MTDDTKGTNPSHNFNNDADQAERLRQLREDMRQRNANAGDDDGGRPYGQARPTPIDTLPLVAPAWSQALGSQPKEAPLGTNVNWLPDCSGLGGRDPAQWPNEFDPPPTEETEQ
jgi:hypothetical protein